MNGRERDQSIDARMKLQERPGFDAEGVPDLALVADWLDLPLPLDTRRLLAVVRFSRPDGSIVFGATGRLPERLKRLDHWAAELGDPSLAGVIARWLPGSRSSTFPPSPLPQPSDSRPDRPLAILRADWTPGSDLMAVDHRQTGGVTLIEVASKGQVWLGPTWSSGFSDGRFAQTKPMSWTSNALAESLEWSFQVGSTRVIRAVTLLRGRSMALLGQQVEGSGIHSEVCLHLASGIEASFVEGSRAVLLRSGPGKPSARLIPLGLPCHDRPTDRGAIAIDGREVVIRQTVTGKRNWLPVLISWGKPPTIWRPLTVASRSKAARDGQAVAFRVAWGARDPGLIVYRSLGPAELRSFLGHQTTARFLVGSFTRLGDVVPILKVEG